MSSPCDLSSHNLLLTKPEQIDGRRRRLRGLVPGNEVEMIVGVKKPSFDYLGDSSKESHAAIEEGLRRRVLVLLPNMKIKRAQRRTVFLSYIMIYGPGDASYGAPAIDQEEMEDMEEKVQADEALIIKKALDAAVKMEDKSDDEVFSEQDKTDVTSYLSVGCQEFNILILHRGSWETATLKISRVCFQIKIEEKFLIDGSFTARYEVMAHERPQLFIVQTPVGSSYVCGEIWEGERNKIVLALKAFREMNAMSVSVPEGYWIKPPIGCLNLNTDGIKLDETGEWAIGGLIRDELGGWVRGFWGKVQLTDGPFNMIMIKLMTLKKGLSLAVELDPRTHT